MDEEASYIIVQYSSSCVWVTAVDAVYSHSGTVVPACPADTSEDEICAAENYVARGIKTKTSAQYGTMLYSISSANSTIKTKWYKKYEITAYAIVQHYRRELHE
jgi:hypothetical protein